MQYSLGNMLKGGGALNPDGLALDLAFALDKTLTARKGPTPAFTRSSTGTFVGSNGLIQSAAINGPRFDHDPATLASKGLLIEEPRTNLLARSEEFGTTWAIFASSISSNSVSSPNGTVSADSLVENTAVSFHSVYQDVSVVGSTVYTFSVYVKAGTRGWVALAESSPNRRTFFNLSTGAVGVKNAAHTASVQQMENGWWRLSITFTAVTTTLSPFAVELAFADGVGSYLGNGSGNVFLWGAQLEAGAFPTSYIPTTSGTAARSADVCSIIGDAFASFYNRIACTVDAVFTPATIAVPTSVCGTNDPRDLEIQMIGGGNIVGLNTNASATQTQISRNPVAVGVKQNFAFASESNNQAVCLNGGTVLASPTWVKNSGVATIFYIGRAGFGGQYSGHIDRITVYRKRLLNAKLQTLTAP